MKIKLLFLITLIFFGEIGFSQSSIRYDSKVKTINLDSGVEGTVGVLVKFYGSNTSDPIFLETMSCGYNDGLQIFSYSDGSILNYSQKETTINFKFKKTVSTNTQIVYKFSTNGSCFQSDSDMIRITVNYKSGATTTPTNPTNPTNPTTPTPNLNTITGSQTINEGTLAALFVGSEMPANKDYSYAYEWAIKKDDGTLQIIPDAIYKDYFPGKVLTTTTFLRRVITSYKGSISGYWRSNEIIVTVIPAPVLQNNTITSNISIIKGSLPTGGTGAYQYSWVLWGAEDPYTFPDTGQNLELSEEMYRYLSWYPNAYIVRYVESASQALSSNKVKVLPISLPVAEIQNNTISINGYQITGSQPIGGVGDYRYSWFLGSNVEDPIWFEEETIDLNLAPYPYVINILQTDPNSRLVRIVRSIKSSTSNKINLYGTSALKQQKLNGILEEGQLTVYPNPTSESLNFSTNFSTDKDIEIVLYSEKLGNEKLVYKGKVAPNQVVNWSIPSNYQKGLYFYKVLSDNKEVKTGKVIFK